MCLVIDTCCLAMVFDGKNKKHSQFTPVLKWINGKGCMIYGGSKYNAELARASRFLPIIAELHRGRHAIQISNTKVDPIAAALKRKHPEPEFDDEHIAALVIASKCCGVCTNDDSAIAYLKRPDLFSSYSGVERPKIYKGHPSHRELCCNKHIVRVCRRQA
jgi:hypothetical protein